MSKLKIYGDLVSGNCLKVKYTAEFLGLDFDWVDVDILAGESRTDDFLSLNPAGQVPLVVLPDGRPLAQSNAIILYLAEGSSLVPADAYDRARVLELLFWEQYSHEPTIAVCRFQMRYLGKSQADLDPDKVARGYQALDFMEGRLERQGLLRRRWLDAGRHRAAGLHPRRPRGRFRSVRLPQHPSLDRTGGEGAGFVAAGGSPTPTQGPSALTGGRCRDSLGP